MRAVIFGFENERTCKNARKKRDRSFLRAFLVKGFLPSVCPKTDEAQSQAGGGEEWNPGHKPGSG